jgi:phosphohistidine phosphatase SixA
MIVGHLPFLGKLVALLVTGSEENEIVEYQVGSIVCIERRDDGKWKVAWMITPAASLLTVSDKGRISTLDIQIHPTLFARP